MPDVAYLELHNDDSCEMVITLEPWAEELTLLPGQTWSLRVDSANDTVPSITLFRGGIAVYGSPDQVLRVYEGETCVWESYAPQ